LVQGSQLNVFSPCILRRSPVERRESGNPDSVTPPELEILTNLQETCLTPATFLGSEGIWVVPSSGQRGYAEMRIDSLRPSYMHPSLKDVLCCFGLATMDIDMNKELFRASTAFPRPKASNCVSWQACSEGGFLVSLQKRVLVDDDEVCETTLLFKEGDILGVLVDCSTDQPVLHWFLNRQVVHSSLLLEAVFNKKLFPAFSVTLNSKIAIFLNPEFPFPYGDVDCARGGGGGGGGAGGESSPRPAGR